MSSDGTDIEVTWAKPADRQTKSRKQRNNRSSKQFSPSPTISNYAVPSTYPYSYPVDNGYPFPGQQMSSLFPNSPQQQFQSKHNDRQQKQRNFREQRSPIFSQSPPNPAYGMQSAFKGYNSGLDFGYGSQYSSKSDNGMKNRLPIGQKMAQESPSSSGFSFNSIPSSYGTSYGQYDAFMGYQSPYPVSYHMPA